MELYRYREFCLCPRGGKLPPNVAIAEAPFSPLVFLVERDPMVNRGFFTIRTLSELEEPEGTNLLAPPPKAEDADALARFIGEHCAIVLNTAFSRAFDVLLHYTSQIGAAPRVSIVGLGNVGGTTATALKLLGTDLQEIGVFDHDRNLCLRYEAELNQALPAREEEPLPPVVIRTEETLFDCDALLFTAAKAVPEIGAESGGDVRMMQYEANRELLQPYARRARERGYTGWFLQVSDPVDQLSRAMFLMSNQNECGEYDWRGLLPEQVRGLGLGVMRARSIYAAKQAEMPFDSIRAYGPHGQGLIIANAPDGDYNDARSRELTHRAETANLAVRSYGFKPYIAPALSSAAASALRALRGEWHDAAVPMGGVYFGCRVRLGALGPETMREKLHPLLEKRIEKSYLALKEFHAG